MAPTIHPAAGAHPATCPVLTPAAWRAAAGIEEEPIFRSFVNRHGELADTRLSDGGLARTVLDSTPHATPLTGDTNPF